MMPLYFLSSAMCLAESWTCGSSVGKGKCRVSQWQRGQSRQGTPGRTTYLQQQLDTLDGGDGSLGDGTGDAT